MTMVFFIVGVTLFVFVVLVFFIANIDKMMK